jgi:hypothetical protein
MGNGIFAALKQNQPISTIFDFGVISHFKVKEAVEQDGRH